MGNETRDKMNKNWKKKKKTHKHLIAIYIHFIFNFSFNFHWDFNVLFWCLIVFFPFLLLFLGNYQFDSYKCNLLLYLCVYVLMYFCFFCITYIYLLYTIIQYKSPHNKYVIIIMDQSIPWNLFVQSKRSNN